MKKVITLFLALVMVLSMVSFAAADEPTELTLVVRRRDTDITESFSEKYWVQKTQEDLNIKLNFVEISENDYKTELATILAGSTLPDCFMVGNSMDDTLVLNNSSLWRPITEEEIRASVPNAAAVYDKYIENWQSFLTYPDGKMYGLPSGLRTSYMHTTDKGLMYINKTWLDNLGLKVPETAEELLDVLRAFRDKDADGDGDLTNEIPFDFCENFFASKIEFLAWMWGLPVTESVLYNITDDDEVVGAVNTDEYRKFLDFAHTLVEEKLASVDGFTQTYDQWAANLNGMKVGVFFGWGPCNYISKSEDFLNITGIITPHAEGYKTRMYRANPIRANRNGFIISKDCKNVEAALKLWNYWSEPNMAMTVTFGPQELSYKYIDDDWNFVETATGVNDESLSTFGHGLERYVGKTITGANTLGYVNNGPLCVQGNSYDPSNLTVWGVQRYVTMLALSDAGVFAPAMNKDIVPADKQEEFDFATDGLIAMVQEFVAQSVKEGVTDESWVKFQSDLTSHGYDAYVEFFNTLYHHGF